MTRKMARWKTRGASTDAPLLYVELADTFWRRFFGLMGRKAIAPSHALLIVPCSGVQMCFMRFAIDVVFLKRRESSGGWQVLKVAHGLRPWLGLGFCGEADAALEMGKGEAERLDVEPGTLWEELRIDG